MAQAQRRDNTLGADSAAGGRIREMKRNDLERALSALGRIPVERIEGICDAERDGRLVVLPCKVGENCFVVSHTDKTITEITVSEFSYSIWHDVWVVAAANGHQFFLDNAYRTRAEAEKALEKEAQHE